MISCFPDDILCISNLKQWTEKILIQWSKKPSRGLVSFEYKFPYDKTPPPAEAAKNPAVWNHKFHELIAASGVAAGIFHAALSLPCTYLYIKRSKHATLLMWWTRAHFSMTMVLFFAQVCRVLASLSTSKEQAGAVGAHMALLYQLLIFSTPNVAKWAFPDDEAAQSKSGEFATGILTIGLAVTAFEFV